MKNRELGLSISPNVLPQTSNNFINVVEKIQRKNVGNDTAWQEAQPLLAQYIENYPEKYSTHLKFLRELFNQRRNSFRGIHRDESLEHIQTMVSTLNDTEIDSLSPVLVCIRDIFNLKSQDRRASRNVSR